MADSNYYYRQYKSYKNQTNSLQDNINKLTAIKNSLVGEFYDEQSDVNKKLDDLKEDLNRAVRHDAKFNTIASTCNSYKEKGSTADADLNNIICALENEIAALNNQRSTAEYNMNQNYQQYQTKREEEQRAWWDSLRNLV